MVHGADRGGKDLGLEVVIVIDLPDVADQIEAIQIDVITVFILPFPSRP